QDTQPPERIYVPTSGATVAQAGSSGQFAPEQPGQSISGRVGSGSTEGSRPGGSGLGALTKIRTPYTEVLGKYAQQATQALDRAYVPPDAKQYVRDYFSELAK